MKKIFGVAAVLALLTGGLATSALAQCGTGDMIDFDADGFAFETVYNPLTFHSTVGSTLKIVGNVHLFCAPLAFLNPADPTKEYTFLCTLTSAGSVHFGPFSGFNYHETDYTAGTWEIHEGSPEDAPTDAGGMPALPSPLVPATFINGPVILSGTLTNFHTSLSTQISTGNTNGSFRSDYKATGGLYFPLIGSGSAVFQGLWCVMDEPAGCRPLTYSAHLNGKWDTPATTNVTKSTWGSLKQLYR